MRAVSVQSDSYPSLGSTMAILAIVPLALLIAAVTPRTSYANGDTVEIFRGRGGPYEIAVGILPEEPVVGTVHFSVTPRDAETAQPVTDARVAIVALDQHGEPTYQARAVNTPASPAYYDTNVTFEAPGEWTLQVDVHSEKLGDGTVMVPLHVGEQSLPPVQAGGVIFFVLVLVLVGGAVYVWHSARRERRTSGG